MAGHQGCQRANFSNQKSPFGYILEDLGIDNTGVFCGHLEYFPTIWYVSWPLDIFLVILAHFSRFGMLHREKSGNLAGHNLFQPSEQGRLDNGPLQSPFVRPLFSRRVFSLPTKTQMLRSLGLNALFGGSATPCASPPPQPTIFSNYSILAYRPVNRDDWHLFAHPVTSDFTVHGSFSHREQLFLLGIKLHAGF
jgi:hypothetical protein